MNDAIIGLTINIGTKDTSLPIFIRVKLAFNNNYEQQKKDIDDPSVGSKSTPQQINTADTTVQPGDWQKDGIKDLLDDSWNFGDFHKYVDYKPTMISNGWEYNQQTKQYERIRNQVTMYCPLLGKTRTFWVVVK